jgi:hypothetical protein
VYAHRLLAQIPKMTFGVFSDYVKTLLAFSRNKHKELRIHLNKFVLLTLLVTLKGQYIQKSNGDYLLAKEEQT